MNHTLQLCHEIYWQTLAVNLIFYDYYELFIISGILYIVN